MLTTPFPLTRRFAYSLAIMAALLLFALLRTAWVGDDAYITFRTVDNIVHGYGPVWNVGERVQSYTHPLWMLILTVFYFVTREPYYTSIVLSLALTFGAAYVMAFKISRSAAAVLSGLAFLIASKAFIEYSTSGLENALAHCLTAIFLWVFFDHARENRSLFWPSFWASLVILTRADLALIVFPPLAYLFFRRPGWKQLGTIILGMLPFFVWHSWSAWYYGFPLPNTAYAKLNTGIISDDLIHQGRKYFENIFRRSTSTALVMIWATVGLIWKFDKKYLAAIFGLLLYCLYILRVGGDYMSGRFFTVPFFVAVMLVVRYHLSTNKLQWGTMITAAVVVVVGLVRPHAPIFQGRDYGLGEEVNEWDSGISDERAGYFQFTGLFNLNHEVTDPHYFWIQRALLLRDAGDTTVPGGAIGMVGYTAGPRVHIVDNHALADPLMARLPVKTLKLWRVGHFGRATPPGYFETLTEHKNLIQDSNLAAFYDTLSLITRGDLGDSDRLRAIVRMNLGKYNYLIQRYLNRPRFVLSYAEASVPKARGTSFNANGCFVISETGLTIRLDAATKDSVIEASLDNNDRYEFIFLHGTEIVGRLTIRDHWIPEGGLAVDTILVPAWIYTNTYDQIDIKPLDGDGSYSVGHIRFLSPD